MPDNKNICLLGFSPESEARIKKIICDDPNNHKVSWVPANHKGLNGVVINAGFLATPQIQKYLSLVSCPVVCAYNNDDAAKQANTYKITALDLRTPQKYAGTWLIKLFGHTGIKENNLHQKQESAKSQNQPQENPSTKKPSPKLSTQKFSDTAHNDTKGLLSQIRRKTNTVIRAECGNDITWIKPKEGLVFINYPRESVPGFELWSWQLSDNREIPESARKLQLDLWLFESLWQSELDVSDEVEKDGYYHLTRFPQPLSRQGRTEALRLATFAQIKPVNIQFLHEKTAYPIERIRRFLFATLIAGQIRKIDANKANIDNRHTKAEQKPRSQQEEQKVEQKRSLLQRFRAKLGL